jgi:hypothetical protein
MPSGEDDPAHHICVCVAEIVVADPAGQAASILLMNVRVGLALVANYS